MLFSCIFFTLPLPLEEAVPFASSSPLPPSPPVSLHLFSSYFNEPFAICLPTAAPHNFCYYAHGCRVYLKRCSRGMATGGLGGFGFQLPGAIATNVEVVNCLGRQPQRCVVLFAVVAGSVCLSISLSVSVLPQCIHTHPNIHTHMLAVASKPQNVRCLSRAQPTHVSPPLCADASGMI